MKLLITGSRKCEATDAGRLAAAIMCAEIEIGRKTSLILHGGALGADSLADDHAKTWGIRTHVIIPNYGRWGGKAAPLVRNAELVHESEIVVAIYAAGRERQGGTWDTVQKAIEAGRPVVECFADGRLKITQAAARLL